MQKIYTRDYYNERIKNHIMFWFGLLIFPFALLFACFVGFGQLFVRLSSTYSPTVSLILFLLICGFVLLISGLIIAWLIYDYYHTKKEYAGQLVQPKSQIEFIVKNKKIKYSRARFDALNPSVSAKYYLISEQDVKFDVSQEIYNNVSEGMSVEVNCYTKSKFVISLKVAEESAK